MNSYKVIYEPYNSNLQNIFLLENNQKCCIGKKVKQSKRPINYIYSEVYASILLGFFKSFKITQDGVYIYYNPFNNYNEKRETFNIFLKNLKTELHYPFPQLNNKHEELIAPDKYWTKCAKKEEELNNTEPLLRKYTIDILKQFDLKNKVLYDPACSTGMFLHEIKEAFPNLITIGQDKNIAMVESARRKNIDYVYLGNSENSQIKDASIDYLIIRFLNYGVVKNHDANSILKRLLKTCKKNSVVMLLGHSPICFNSISLAQFNLKITQKIGITSNNTIVQFYIANYM